MPFTKLVDRHSCPTPVSRDDGSGLECGDEWQCDQVLVDGSGRECGKRWRRSESQLDGPYWQPINER